MLVWLSAGKRLLAVIQGMHMNASIELAPNFESDVGETKKFPRLQQLVGLSWKHSLCMPSLHSGKKGPD